MGQYNINEPPHTHEGEQVASAGLNLLAVLIVAIVVLLVAWWLFTGPVRLFGTGSTNINVQPPNINVYPPANTNPGNNVNPPANQPPAPKPMTFTAPVVDLHAIQWET